MPEVTKACFLVSWWQLLLTVSI